MYQILALFISFGFSRLKSAIFAAEIKILSPESGFILTGLKSTNSILINSFLD